MSAATIGTLIAAAILAILWIVERGKNAKLESALAAKAKDVTAAKEETLKVRRATENAIREARKLQEQRIADAAAEVERIRLHYDAEAKASKVAADEALSRALLQLESLKKYEALLAEEGDATRMLTEAIAEATQLRETARLVFESSKARAEDERRSITSKAKEMMTKADAILDQATRDAGRLIEEAHREALKIGGDAYTALREKATLEAAVVAIRNVVEGYGDRYVVPTRSVLDDLAEEFGHLEAGQALTAARAQSKRMVEEGQAATCDYAEAVRRETAIRFVVIAFNGAVDAILSRSRDDNRGVLEQEIRDEFALVNLNGEAFRNARILPAYLDARLSELKWGVVGHELKEKEREEQRRLKEQIREEERARREYEKAVEDAQREERAIEKALVTAREQVEQASAEQRLELEARIAELNEKLVVAEAKNQRALSMAQQTKKGTIYVISNVGSFGDDVFKIGMTRRLEPMDRIKELGDASVPFEFDVHAMISSEDAPALEAKLHRQFDDLRLNRVNARKEFFRMPLERLRDTIMTAGVEASFTMLAEAREYRETQALSKMTPEERASYRERQAI